jgi:protein-S-isoprenylcysteine O-methyltransferase Ste14
MFGQDRIALWAYGFVIVCWLAFLAVFLLFQRRWKGASTARRAPASKLGIAFQFTAYGLLWTWPLQRPHFTPIIALPVAAELLLLVFTMVLATASVWLVGSAARTLGRQWSLEASLIENHQLITAGPYRWVRNPIYTGMFGLLIATGLAVTRWQALTAAIVAFAVGTVIRVRSEEKLLREAFGKQFEQYAEQVPALVPRLF